jgi:hypothetical protein
MLETDQAPIVVPVELDLQQASKMADEKRKRNAEASARFRARRSEKEKEASQTISTLEQELQELREERDFYRNERNYIRDFATRHVEYSYLLDRPRRKSNAVPPVSIHEASRSMEESGCTRSELGPTSFNDRRLPLLDLP